MKRVIATVFGTMLTLGAVLPLQAGAVNPILPLNEYIPDVEAQIFTNAEGEERVYLYGSHDNYPSSTWCSYQYRVYSAPVDDLNNWTDHGVSFASRKGEGYIWNGEDADGVDWSDSQLYAPDVEYAEGKYWLVSCMAGGGLGMSVSDTPEGPFSPAVKICYDDTREHLPSIDPSIFYDNGTMYLVWGQSKAFGAEGCVGVVLEKDANGMYSVAKSETKTMLFDNEGHSSDGFGFYEGPSLGKFDNGQYYIYFPSGNGSEVHSMAYATADEPLGKYTYRGIIIDPAGTDVVGDNCHGSLCKINGQWYAFYHRGVNGSYTRRVCVEPITVQEDGTIEQVEVTSRGFSGPLNPYETVETSYASRVWMPGSARSCYLAEESADLHFLTNLKDGDCVEYKDFDFGDQEDQLVFLSKIRSKAGGSVDVILDDPEAAPVGTLMIPAGSSDSWEELRGIVKPISGVHTLYLKFHSDSGSSIGDMATFRFETLVPMFKETFQDGLNAWEHTENAAIVDGKLHLSDNVSMAEGSGAAWQNYVVQAEITRENGTAGLAFRRVGEGYQYLFILSEDKAAYGICMNGEYRELAAADGQFNAGEAYQVQVECAGSEMRAYVNDELILEASDDTLSVGNIGFVQPEGSSAYFDNIVVVETAVSRADRILVNGLPLDGFSTAKKVYTLKVRPGAALPSVEAASTDPEVEIRVTQAEQIPGEATVVFSKNGVESTYTIRFRESLQSRNDMFDGETYSDAWEILNPNPDKVTYVQNEGLRLQTDFGEIGEDRQTENIFLQTAEGNWSMETKITFNSATGFGQAGLTVYSSKTDYIKFTRMANGVIEGRNYNNGEMDQFLYQGGVALTDNTLWLRAKKFGNQYIFSYSTDGVNYTDARTTVFDAQDPQIGLVANGSNVGGTIDATFHYFKFTDESLQSDYFDGDNYGDSWNVLNSNPDLVTYTKGEGLRIESSAGEIDSDPQAENIFLQSGDDDWTVETKMLFNGASGYGQAGLTVYESKDSFIKFIYMATGTIEGKLYQDGQMVDQFLYQSVALENSTLWLRAEKTDNQYTFSYSTDGVSFTAAKTVTLEADNVQVGLVANGSNAGGNVDVTFQYFKAEKNENFLPDVVPVDQVEFLEPVVTVDEGGLVTLQVQATPEDASYRDVTWNIVEGEGVVRFETDSHGKTMIVRGVSEGTAVISATIGGKTATCEVTVQKQDGPVCTADAAIRVDAQRDNNGNVVFHVTLRDAKNIAAVQANYNAENVVSITGENGFTYVPAGGEDGIMVLCYNLDGDPKGQTFNCEDETVIATITVSGEKPTVQLDEVLIAAYEGEDGRPAFGASVELIRDTATFRGCDINEDGTIDLLDVVAAMKFYQAKKTDGEIWESAQVADINGDEKVDLEDLIGIVLNYAE